MSNKIFGYARVSSKEQNMNRQIDSLKKYVVDEHDIFLDKQSGKDLNRPALQTLMNSILRDGDELYIHSLDRLGRNKDDIKKVLTILKEKGVIVHILDIPTTMVNYTEQSKAVLEMVTNLLIEVIGFVAESERINIRKRQAEGIASAKMRGIQLGRPKKVFPASWEKDYSDWKNKLISATDLAEKYNWNRATFYRKVKEYESEIKPNEKL